MLTGKGKNKIKEKKENARVFTKRNKERKDYTKTRTYYRNSERMCACESYLLNAR